VKESLLKAHQQDGVAHPPELPVARPVGDARTVLARKGSLRRAKSRRALAPCAPFRRRHRCDGRLRRDGLRSPPS
jgi:hypothetical protein